MKRRNQNNTPADEAPLPDASPLIDICFLLLIYFLVAATIAPRESDLTLALPGSQQKAGSPEIEPLLIRIAENGAIEAGSLGFPLAMDQDAGQRDLPLLRSHLEFYAAAAQAADSMPLVKLEPSPETNHQRLMDVLNTLAAAGIRSVSFTDNLPVR